MERKKLRLIQLTLFLLGLITVFYSEKTRSPKQEIISKETQDKIKKQLAEQTDEADVFTTLNTLV